MTISFDDFKKAHANYSSIGAHKESSWSVVIGILNREGWTPHEYLDYVFREFKRPMVPGLLGNEDIVEAYRVARNSRMALNERRSKWVREQLRIRLANHVPLEDVFEDAELQSHALFMYLVAARAEDEKAMAKFREPALYELRTMPELESINLVTFNRRLFPHD